MLQLWNVPSIIKCHLTAAHLEYIETYSTNSDWFILTKLYNRHLLIAASATEHPTAMSAMVFTHCQSKCFTTFLTHICVCPWNLLLELI